MPELGAADHQALDILFSDNRQSFIKAAEKITGCRSHAEDVVHDAFLRLLAGERPEVGSRLGYVLRVVRNLAIDRYRRRRTELRVLADTARDADPADVASPDRINMHRQMLRLVEAALAELPARTRYAFEMHRIRGVSQKEIAATLGVSPTLVNFMIRDALVHCRKRTRGLLGEP